MQLQAGYIHDFVKNKLLTENKQFEILALLDHLCYFEVDGISESEENSKPELAVINNLLSRGLPTRPSLFIEKCFLKALQLGEIKTDALGSIEAVPNQSFNSVAQYLFKSLHIIDPKVHPNRNRFQIEPSFEFANIGSQYEEDFLFNHVPRLLGPEWFQLLETQREFTSIVNLDNNFTRQRTDFTVEFPFPIANKKGIIIEIDGFHHWENQNQRNLDEQRDAKVLEVDWMNTLRIETRNFNRIEQQLLRLRELTRQPYFQNLRLNYQTPLYNKRDGLLALQLTLSPIAIARIQKTIIQLLLEDKIDLQAPKWKIAVIERDVPCAALALADLKNQLKNIFAMQDKVVSPNIELTVFTSAEFQTSQINQVDYSEYFSKIRFIDFNNQHTENSFDVLIDISVLQRKGFSGYDNLLQAREKCVVRSIHHKHSSRTFLTSDIIEYKALVAYNPNNTDLSVFDNSRIQILRTFLQDIFRKNTFRGGQPEILSKALQGESVIGLLPTGGGKSLTYQLAAMLQPGVCLVIDPIKSLMRDQFDNLNNNQIDACNFINSSIKTREQKTKETAKLKNGEVLVTFISPERLQMKEFRDILTEMNDKGIYFNYCVIDEAHCVSEWGHDFRTSYLSLGKNAIELCKTKNRETIPLFGLTATASFDVLSDVQRELSGNNERFRLKEDSIIRFDSVNREELGFEIIDVNADLKDTDNDWRLKEKLGTKKQSILIDKLSRFPFDNQNIQSGIIFCPHRGWYFGVTDRYRKDDKRNAVYDAILRAANPNLRLGSFMGSDSDDEKTAEIIEADSIQAQDDFINNKLNLLVSTKAFGMGIDKPNIRFTYHLNYPSSIESFIQEAGRAGRDKQPATSFILFNDEQIKKGEKTFEIDRENLLFFHNSSFKGVEKEKAILFELLSSIYTPNKTSEIELHLAEQFGLEFNLSLWKNENDVWYITTRGDSPEIKYGSIKLTDYHKTLNTANQPQNICNSILDEIIHYIQQNALGNVIDWLNSTAMVDGLETLLRLRERVTLTLSFQNNTTQRIETIRRWLNAAFNTRVFNAVQAIDPMKDILSFSNSFIDFKEQVTSKLNNGSSFEQAARARDRARNNQIGTAERELQRLFDGYRIKADTEKALYRLSTVGVIDDYTVDFNSKTYTVYARRKTDEQYYKNLENYIRKYYSEVRTKQEIRKAKHFEGATTIQKCLYFLTDFVYREIEKKRFEGIGVMKEACEIGKENGGEAFKEFVELYFNSKYARKGYEVNGENKSLTDRTEEGRQENIKWVWEFIEVIDEDKSGGHINNLKHLRGACVRLLIPQPDNAVFHLLKAFSIFILEPENIRLIDEASNSFAKGFIGFQKDNSWPFDRVLKEAEKYKNYVLQFSTHSGILEIMQNQITILSVKVHSQWLENFNNKFLEQYEQRYPYTS
jgi:ATP-dependent DNA helicase RecQ